MFATGETNKLFVFSLIAIGAILAVYAAYSLTKVQLG